MSRVLSEQCKQLELTSLRPEFTEMDTTVNNIKHIILYLEERK